MATIFIVDDDQAIGEMLSLVLENEGFQTVTCLDGLRAVEMFPIVKPDLILLDVMLPGLDGTGVARRIRATSNVPIIMLTAKSDTLDVVAGLEAGADDYVPKPFKVAELLARIHARFRIAKPAAEDGATGGASGGNANGNHLERGPIVIDRLEHTATKDGKDLNLTPTEFELLFMLAAPVFTFFISPLFSQLSRRHEFQADAYAVAQASGADLSSALLKLYEDNASTLTPDPVYVKFYYSHPPATERLARMHNTPAHP